MTRKFLLIVDDDGYTKADAPERFDALVAQDREMRGQDPLSD